MTRADDISQLGRVASIAAPLLVAFALVATAWSNYRQVNDASDELVRGQADLMQQMFRARRVELGRLPTSEDLAAFVDEQAAEGLRYVATLDGQGKVIASAGQPAGMAGVEPGRDYSPGELLAAGERVRLVFWRPGWQPSMTAAGRPRVPFVLEFEPTVAAGLRAAAARNLSLGMAAAGALLVVSFLLLRWFARRAEAERERAHQRRLAGLGHMSAVLAHEIRNPLASLKGNAQLLARSLSDDARHRAKAERVVTEAVRLESLTNHLLEFARAGAIERAPVDPAAVLRDAAATVKPERIVIDPAGAPPAWPMDRERIRQVLTNLLENAVQAGDGPVRARVSSERGKLVYEVRDRGAGIPAGEQERIFEPFHTLRTRGTGLGLAVARRLVEMHGGTITADNAIDGGAVFRVVLPAG